MTKPLTALVVVSALAVCGARPIAQTLPAPKVPLEALPQIDPDKILDHIKQLGSDAFQGRAPGTEGENKTVAYLESHFKIDDSGWHLVRASAANTGPP